MENDLKKYIKKKKKGEGQTTPARPSTPSPSLLPHRPVSAAHRAARPARARALTLLPSADGQAIPPFFHRQPGPTRQSLLSHFLLPRCDSSREGSSQYRIKAAISLSFSRKPTPINPLGQPRGLLFASRLPNRALAAAFLRFGSCRESHQAAAATRPPG